MSLTVLPLRPVFRELFVRMGYPVLYALLFGGAFISSLFFNGTHIEYFATACALLTLLMLVILWRGYDAGFHLPKTGLALAVTLFWSWLALGLIWTRVPYVSMVNFWWVGNIAFVFWLAVLTTEPERYWRWMAGSVLLVGLFLAGMGLYQLLVLHTDPRSTFLSRNSHAALLILIAVPASGYFLLTSRRFWLAVAGPALFLLFLSIAITGSRGVLLSLLLSVGILAGVSYRHVAKRQIVIWLSMIVAAYVLANLLLEGWLVGRLSSVLAPSSAGHDRFLIWSGALKMALDAPWLGIGLGTFWLAWPPYRHPADSSAGFYVHNDYLQLWIEAGLPGVLLLLAIEAAVLMMLVRTLRNPKTDTATRVETAGLVGGLAAIALHSFFDFDLYIQPIILVIGLILARLQFLQRHHTPLVYLSLQPANWVGRRIYHAITLLLLLFPLMYFAALGGSAKLTIKARDLMTQSRLVEASETLTYAARLMPTSDLVLITHADLLRQAITLLPSDAPARSTLYREAQAFLDRAERRNPFRAQVFFIRGLLYDQNPDLAGKDGFTLAARAYAAALKRDPLAYWSREAYAGLLARQGRWRQAKQILEEGADYHYSSPGAVNYLVFLAHLRRQAGELERAAALEKKISLMIGRPATSSVQSSTPPAKLKPFGR